MAPHGTRSEIEPMSHVYDDESTTDVSSEDLPTVSDPHKLRQPHLKTGVVDANGLYHNSFGRSGKELHTGIIVHRGALRNLDGLAKGMLPTQCRFAKNYVITDTIVDPLYGGLVLSGLRKAGFDVHKIVVPADSADASGESTGEPHKNTDVLMKCCDEVLRNGVSKHSCVISLGGGVVNNLCGVIACMVYRGISLVHITTTSMGMLDASIDFKQAVNHPLGKNLLGCYYPASTILMDPETLGTLSNRHILNGIAEALKHGFAQSVRLVEHISQPLRERGSSVLRDPEYLEGVCKASIEIKCPTLDFYHDSDYNEMVPQYGHAVGHAIEHLSWSGEHKPLLHGEAVAVGMCVSAEIARNLGLCNDRCVEEHYEVVQACGLPAFVPQSISSAAIRNKMMYDKHFVKSPSMGLPAEMGRLALCGDSNSYAWQIKDDVLEAALVANASRRESVAPPPLSRVRLSSAFAATAGQDCKC